MSYVMRLFLAGLIAFAPSQNGSGVQILLLDARSERQVGHCLSHVHIPFLIVKKGNVIGDAEQCSCRCEDEGEGFCCFSLEKVSVQIHGLKDQSFKRVEGVRGVGLMSSHQLPESSLEGPDVSWLADMAKVASKGGKLLKGTSSNDGLVSRLEMRKGRMETCHLVKMGDGELERVPVFEFRSFGSPGSKSRLDQVLADDVKVEASMESEFVTIYRIPFDPGSAKLAPINLKTSSDGHLSLAITNLPQGQHGAQNADCEYVDVDFIRFFDLLDPFEKEKPLPHCSNVFGSVAVEPSNCDDDVLRDFFKGVKLRKIRRAEACTESAYTRPICAMATFPQ